MLSACHRHRSYVTLCEASFVAHSGHFPVLHPYRATALYVTSRRMIAAGRGALDRDLSPPPLIAARRCTRSPVR